eukprot:5250227-Alexandrium_andersonii.AAC.1
MLSKTARGCRGHRQQCHLRGAQVHLEHVPGGCQRRARLQVCAAPDAAPDAGPDAAANAAADA